MVHFSSQGSLISLLYQAPPSQPPPRRNKHLLSQLQPSPSRHNLLNPLYLYILVTNTSLSPMQPPRLILCSPFTTTTCRPHPLIRTTLDASIFLDHLSHHGASPFLRRHISLSLPASSCHHSHRKPSSLPPLTASHPFLCFLGFPALTLNPSSHQFHGNVSALQLF